MTRKKLKRKRAKKINAQKKLTKNQDRNEAQQKTRTEIIENKINTKIKKYKQRRY